jgi:hypothetical protein
MVEACRGSSGGPTCTTLWGSVSVLHVWRVCLANFLAIGEPRGAGAATCALSWGGVFSLGGACMFRVLLCALPATFGGGGSRLDRPLTPG